MIFVDDASRDATRQVLTQLKSEIPQLRDVSGRLQQETGLRWSGGVDAYGATLLAGCDGTRPLGALLSVLASSAGIPEGEAAEQVLPVVHRLVEQGFLEPAPSASPAP